MDTIKELLKRPIAYQPIMAKAFGSVKLAILWAQMYYWSDKGKNEEGWIYKTREDLFEETGLSRKEQETARTIGAKLGVLESKRMGQPCTVHFRVNLDKAVEIVEKWVAENVKEESKKEEIILQKTTAVGPTIKKETIEALEIFNFWNEQKIVTHRKLTDKIITKIKSALREYSEQEVKEAISKYGQVINGEGFFWTYRWTLPDFLQRGLTRFLETPIENFKVKKIEKPKQMRQFYRGCPVVEKNGRKYVIEQGEWKEFAGRESDLENKLV
jgi:hypothetical protein